METLVKTGYARNMWRIMETFKVLPTDERFLNLSTLQIEFILDSMRRDNWEQAQMAKGREHYDNLVEDADTNFLKTPESEFEVVPEFLDAEDIWNKTLSRLSDSERRKHEERMKDEFEDGGQNAPDLHHESIMEQIRRNIEELDDEMQNGKFKEEKEMVISKETIANALEEFGDDDII